jgi:hypothetical protein
LCTVSTNSTATTVITITAAAAATTTTTSVLPPPCYFIIWYKIISIHLFVCVCVCGIWSSYNSVLEYSSLVGCGSVLEWPLVNMVLYPRSLEWNFCLVFTKSVILHILLYFVSVKCKMYDHGRCVLKKGVSAATVTVKCEGYCKLSFLLLFSLLVSGSINLCV